MDISSSASGELRLDQAFAKKKAHYSVPLKVSRQKEISDCLNYGCQFRFCTSTWD